MNRIISICCQVKITVVEVENEWVFMMWNSKNIVHIYSSESY